MIWFGKLGKILSISLHYLTQGEREREGVNVPSPSLEDPKPVMRIFELDLHLKASF
jgi:hypothetical protein